MADKAKQKALAEALRRAVQVDVGAPEIVSRTPAMEMPPMEVTGQAEPQVDVTMEPVRMEPEAQVQASMMPLEFVSRHTGQWTPEEAELARLRAAQMAQAMALRGR